MKREVDERALPLVSDVARNISRRFRGYTTFADVQQEAYLWLLDRPKKHVDILDDETKGERYLKTALRRHCEREARRTKADHLGTRISDEYFYDSRGTQKIENVLPFIFNYEDWMAMPESLTDQERVSSGGGDPAEGGNWLAIVLDVKAAYQKLEPQQRRIMYRTYHGRWPRAKIAQSEQVSVSYIETETRHALNNMRELLGGETPW